MKTKYIYIILVFTIISSCASTKTVDTSQIRAIVEKQHFAIESDIAQPSAKIGLNRFKHSGNFFEGHGYSHNNVNLAGNNNTLKLMGDLVSTYLPYYGELYANAGYGMEDGTIKFNGGIKNYNILWNDKKQSYTITFQAWNNIEMFDVKIVLYANLKSYLTLSSSSRTSITYIGKVVEIDDNSEV